MPKASWLPVAFVCGQLDFCPALPCPALGLYVPYSRLGPYDVTALQPDTSSQEQHSSSGTPFSLASGGWVILNQPIPVKPGCLLLTWESGQDEGRISLVQRRIIIDWQNMNLRTIAGQG